MFINSDEEDANEGQMLHFQGDLLLGDPKVISLCFDLCFLKNIFL